ncbi:MAG TPA: FAD synthase [Nanoarchaeota archaeon]|nr:FAD synthase [Nanoarchaeota archaeon]
MKRKILIAGTFDILHLGHIKLFEWVKKRFDGELVVIVARDENVEKIKGRKPVFSEKERKKMLEAIRFVDKVVLGDKKDFLKPILKEKPEIIVLGYDQWMEKKELEKKLKSLGIKAKVVKAPKFNPEKWKSSKILEKIMYLNLKKD